MSDLTYLGKNPRAAVTVRVMRGAGFYGRGSAELPLWGSESLASGHVYGLDHEASRFTRLRAAVMALGTLRS